MGGLFHGNLPLKNGNASLESLFQWIAAVSQTSRSSLYVLRLTLRVQPRPIESPAIRPSPELTIIIIVSPEFAGNLV